MHIPDGFLNTATSVATWAASAGSVAVAVRQVNKRLNERQVPLMGISAAFIFAAQMMNFTVAGGTSGHLLGGALAAILLGPWAGTLVIASVLAVQALLFQDGGLLAMGANIFNMAVVGVWAGWFVYASLKRLLGEKGWAVIARGFVAGWVSVMLASLLVSVELTLSDASPWGVVLPAMGGVHALIGIGEGLITVVVLAFLRATRPDLLTLRASASEA
ncbi:MAG: energy-coupling factor ABC transporter permease [Anaerolineae bacterium]|nr:energy-coupling factor ABC transporter permease [Anaerolineae bacterium]